MPERWPIFRKGDKENGVFAVQSLLRAHGHEVEVDGDFGPKTESAVRAFQQARGLQVDGVVGNRTWEALVIQVRRGSRGEAVRGVQRQLNLWRPLFGDPGSPELEMDGDFGPKTESAVRAVQRWAMIDVDGIVGPETWNQLVSF
jgi:peptidoglycan hydrolase-like protein with peptidoglycan-binding domain